MLSANWRRGEWICARHILQDISKSAKVECPTSFGAPRSFSALSFRMHNTAKISAHVVLRANDLIGAAIGVVLGQQKDISKDLILRETQIHKHVA